MTSIELVTLAAPVIAALQDAIAVVVDTETRSLHPWRDGKILAGIGVKVLNGPAFYMPVRHAASTNAPPSEVHALAAALRGKTLIFHNAKFDLAVLEQEGESLIDEDIIDTVILWRLVSENEPSYELKKLAVKYIDDAANFPELELKRAMKKMGWATYADVPATEILSYVTGDLAYPEWLFIAALPIMKERGLEELWKLEQRTLRSLYDMERRGFKLDRKLVSQRLPDLRQRASELQKQAFGLIDEGLQKRRQRTDLGEGAQASLQVALGLFYDEQGAVKGFNIHSPHDVRKVFRGFGKRSTARTKKGGESWGKEALEEFDSPLARLIVAYRAVEHASAYYDNLSELVGADDMLHASIHQAGARTGRMSVRDPALQTLPTAATASTLIDAEEAQRIAAQLRQAGKTWTVDAPDRPGDDELRAVRNTLVPREGHALLIADWSQAELCLLANYSREPKMLRAFELGLDIHKLTAHGIYDGLAADPVELLRQRRTGKDFNFGIVYGMGRQLFAIKLGDGSNTARAELFTRRYFERYAAVAEFRGRAEQRIAETTRIVCPKHHREDCDQCAEVVELGYVKDMWGRRRYLSPRESYKAINFLVQGSSGDMLKDTINRLHEALRPYRSAMLLPVHDELIFEVADGEEAAITELVVREMTSCAKVTRARLHVDLKWSRESWGAASPLRCDGCSGYGDTYALASAAISRDEMFDLLVQDDWAQLNALARLSCRACAGRGYLLEALKC